MRHLTYATKTLFISDETGDLVAEYARLLAQSGRSDTVDIDGVGADGNHTVITILLNPSSELAIEETDSELSVDADPLRLEALRDRIETARAVDRADPEQGWAVASVLPDMD